MKKKNAQKIRENVEVDKKSAYVIYEWPLSPVDHPRELLQALRSDNNTVHFHCFDGDFSSSVLLLAAVSPLLQEIGRQISSCDCREINLLLPDHSVKGQLTSE